MGLSFSFTEFQLWKHKEAICRYHHQTEEHCQVDIHVRTLHGMANGMHAQGETDLGISENRLK